MTKMNERRLPATEVRTNLSEALNLAGYGSTATVIEKHGRPAAAIVPLSCLPVLTRADELMASGEFGSIQDIRQQLQKEGLLPPSV